jgi:hypothetical protein
LSDSDRKIWYSASDKDRAELLEDILYTFTTSDDRLIRLSIEARSVIDLRPGLEQDLEDVFGAAIASCKRGISHEKHLDPKTP